MIANIETCFWALHKSQFLNRHECAVLKIKPGGRTPYFCEKRKSGKLEKTRKSPNIKTSLAPSIISLSFENKTTLELRLENDRLNGDFEIFFYGK